MLQGIHLSLLIGPGLPLPAPKAVIDAVQSVRVTSGRDRSGFQITLAAGKGSPLLTTLLPAGFFDPISTRVIIVVTLRSFPHVLMDGVVTQQELAPGNGAGQSTLTLTGEDLSVLMDVVELKMPFPQMSDTMQAYAMLAPYAAFGIVPTVIPSFILDIRTITEGTDYQTGTHLQRLKYLADANGFVFYVEPGPLPGQSMAYMGPNIRVPVPQPALSVNMDAHTNVESMSFSLDGLAKETMVVTVLDPITRKIPIPLPIPDISVFQPPLGARPTPPAKITFANDKAGVGVQRALKTVVGRLLKGSANAITVSGSLNVLRYGHVLRSRALVGVRGAGIAYDGLYYVDSVTHDIKRGEFKQSFQLSRDGLISLTPKVPV